ncbi:hypothetical protein E24_00329 [Faustovirus]|nr:220 kDa polyprotein [Faustovirus]AMN82936.1 hypothetical protein E24_00329 [Faustovirus]AMN83923.1 hypothetical protein D5a_00326 [Faustovirus]AMN84908.1 hypothetical protein E23_00328 [Faustovirus]QBR99218.1 220 kDa polyprotein [Faustovirus mariensis]
MGAKLSKTAQLIVDINKQNPTAAHRGVLIGGSAAGYKEKIPITDANAYVVEDLITRGIIVLTPDAGEKDYYYLYLKFDDKIYYKRNNRRAFFARKFLPLVRVLLKAGIETSLAVAATQSANIKTVAQFEKGVKTADKVGELFLGNLQKSLEQGGVTSQQLSSAINGAKDIVNETVSEYKQAEDAEAGAQAQHGGNLENPILGAYDDLMEDFMGGCGDCGGFSGGFFGGDDEADDSVLAGLRDYTNSRASASKQHILDSIIGALKNFNIKIEGKDREDIIKNILKQLPNGRDRKFKDNAEVHTKVCRGLAQAINAQYGSNVINMDLPAEQICSQVAELLVSIQGDAYTEFLFVRGEAEKVLRNIQFLLDQLKIAKDKEDEKVKSISMDAYNEGIEMDNLQDIITGKAREQLQVLGNLLNVKIKKIDQDLSELLNDQEKLNKYIENLNGQRGTAGFSKVVTDILNAMGTTAGLVNIIENALKEIGMSIDEYAKLHDIKEFRAKVQSAMQGKNFTDEQLKLFLNSVELLRKNFYRSKDIAEYKNAKQISGQGESNDDMDTHMDNIADVSGGVDTQRLEHLDKRIANRSKLRNILVANFAQRAQDLFENIVKALGVMSKKVGSEIPLSDQLDGLRSIMQRVSAEMSNQSDAYLSLLGYYRDAMSKSRKDRFIGDLKMLNSYIETILEMDMYRSSAQYFRDIHTNIKALIELIDKTSDEMLSKFGMGEDSITGGDDQLTDIIGTLNIKKRSPQRIVDALIDFDYYYRVAQIKQNLSRTTSELDHYVESYEKLTTESIAERLKSSYDKYVAHRKLIEERRDQPQVGLPGQPGFIAAIPANDKPRFDMAIKLLDEQWDSAKKFWATVEAVDAYLRHFTDGIMKSPTDIKDIKSMLDDIVVIHDWYSPKNGDEIAAAFDDAPADANLNDNNFTPGNVAHYYEALVGANAAAVGKPQFATLPTKVNESRAHLRKSITNLGALKNLLSIFVYIGNKFGGNELRTKIFLTPAQIYNNLVDFMVNCAYTPYLKDTTAVADKYKVNSNFSEGKMQFEANGAVNTAGVVDNSLASFHMAMVGDDSYDMWGQEHALFYDLIKGLAAKVFTVLGTYDLFDRPLESNRISPIRFVIGGDDSVPKVEEEAVELYLRLTLLAQFYKRLFSFDEAGGDNPYAQYPDIRRKGDGVGAAAAAGAVNEDYLKITLVPDVDGVFSGLIKLIFREIPHSGEDKYTEDEVKSMIREINLIYGRMKAKHAQNTVMETIYEFVGEINRRYGIVKAKEHDALVDEYMMRYDYGKAGVIVPGELNPITDYAILPGEEDDVIERPSPAQKLLAQRIQQGGITMVNPEVKKPRILADAHRRLLYNFRCLIDKQFDGIKDMEQFNFKSAIKLAQGKLKREQSDVKRFGIISALMRGVDVYTKVNVHKYLMFHETVIAGLNTLSAIHTLLTKFRKQAFVFDYEGVLKGAANEAAVIAKMVDSRLIWNPAAGIVDDNNIAVYNNIVSCIFGRGEAAAWNQTAGGNANNAMDDQNGNVVARNGDRYKFNKPYIVKSIIDLFVSLGQDLSGLVEVSFDAGKFRLSTGNLRKLIEDLFADVSQFLELLRPQLDDEFVLKYVSKEMPGSYYWLQEQLLEKIIIGRPANRRLIPDPNKPYTKYDNLDEVVRSLNDTLAWAMGKFGNQSPMYGNLFAELVYHDAVKPSSGLRPSLSADVAAKAQLVDYKTNPYESLFYNVGDRGKTLDTRYIFRYKQLYTFDREITFNRSIVHMFNQLVAKYIQAFYDTVPGKIYSGAISGILNGHLSRAIADQDMTYPDTVPAVFMDNRTANVTTLAELATYLIGGAVSISSFDLLYNSLQNMYDNWAVVVAAFPGLDADVTKMVLTDANYRPGAPNSAVTLLAHAIIASVVATAVTSGIVVGARAGANFGAVVQAINGADPVILLNELVASTMGGQPSLSGRPLGRILAGALPSDAAGVNFNHSSEVAVILRVILSNINAADKPDKLRVLAAGIMYEPKNTKRLGDVASRFAKGILSRNQVKFAINQDEADMVYDAGMDAYDANLVSGPRSYLRIAHSGNDALLPSGDYYQYLGKRFTVPAGGIGINQVGSFGQLADADKDHVLFTSLSVILKNIATSRVAGNAFYTTDNLGEVTAYMKEKYRAFAPYFKCLFKAMIDKCLMMKKVISEKKLNLGKFPVAGIQNPWPGKLPAYEQDSERHRDRLLGVLDAVINGSNDFIKSCDVLAREVGDDARYLELYNNAIKDYKTQNGFDPLMPLSSSLYFLKDVTPAHADELLPVGNFGEDGFKFLYGARLLLHPYDIKISGENLVGFNDLVSVYNMTIDGKMALPADLVGKFSENFAKATRFLFGAKYIRGMETMNVMRVDEDYRNITNGGAYAANALVNNAAGILRTKFVDDSANPISNRADYSIVVAGNRPAIALDDGGVAVNISAYAANKQPACVFSIAKDLALVLRLSESNSRDDRVKDIVDYLVAFVDSPNARLDIQNIVDLNLIPINIHALARDIPLAFLYNYAYTFDRLAVDNFYPGSARAAKVIKNLCADNLGGDRVVIDSAKDAFLSSLINPDYNPFADGSVDVYENYIKPMMVGATGNDLGRPKFISDELFGKVLFGEIYKTGQYSEIGPQASYSGVDKAATAVKILNEALTGLLSAGATGVCLFAYAGAGANAKANRDTTLGAQKARVIRDISELIMNNKPTTFKKAFTLVKSLLPQPNAANAADVTNSKMAATEISLLVMILYPIIINQINNLPMNYAAQNLPQLADATRMINNYYVGFDETEVDGLQGADRDAKVAVFNAGVVSPVTTKVANAALPGDVSDLPSTPAGNRVPANYNGITGIDIAQKHVVSSGHGYSVNLHYLKNGERKTKDNEVDVDATQVGVVKLRDIAAGKSLYDAGRARYNTTVVRQLLFITNLYRLVRLRLQRDLVYSKEVIMRSVPITRNEITELNGNSLNRQNAYENYKNDPRYRYYLVVKRNP